MPRFSRLAGVLALVTLLLWGAAPASAHDSLLASTPADGTVLDVAPEEIVLEMSAVAIELGTEIQVLDSGQSNVAAGPPVVADRFVTVPLGGIGPGAYAVVWRVVSSDGHPIEGSFEFSVTDAAVTESTAPSPAVSVSEPPSEVSSGVPSEAGSESASESAGESAGPETSPAAAPSGSGQHRPPGVVALIAASGAALAATAWWLARRRRTAPE